MPLVLRDRGLVSERVIVLLLLCLSIGGLISAIVFASVIAPWNGGLTLLEQVCSGAFMLTAIIYMLLCWYGYFLIETRESLRAVMWAILVTITIHAATGITLAVELMTQSNQVAWIANCLARDSTYKVDDCQGELETNKIVAPTCIPIVPICGIILCYYVYLFTTLPPESQYTRPLMDEVPAGWDTPPASYAPDSSDSDSERYFQLDAMGKKTSKYQRPRYERRKSKRSDSSAGTGMGLRSSKKGKGSSRGTPETLSMA